MRNRYIGKSSQRGVVAIIVGLTLVALVAFAGLALDGGHLYLTRTELQNGADACALAAARDLTGSPIPAANFTNAENSGKTVGNQNRVEFQGGSIPSETIDVTFSASLSGPWVSAAGAPGNAQYVRCLITRAGITPWLMGVLGIGDQTVSALATATLSPSQNNCAIPMGLCTPAGTSAPDFGYVKGNWYSMNFDESGGGGVSNMTGNFRWIDFDPSSTTPGCSGGGAQELACLFNGAGQCSLPPLGPATCPTSGNSTPVEGCVGQTGSAQSLGKGFNSRFGICQGGGSCSDAELTSTPPDFTGFAYTAATWPLGHNAYDGASGGVRNFGAARAVHDTVQSSLKPSGTGSATTDQLSRLGADRRLVTVPFVDCDDFAGGQHAPIRGYACVLLLHPYDKDSGHVNVTTEYLGASNEPGSPCATSGAVGGPGSIGPLVPALVQ